MFSSLIFAAQTQVLTEYTHVSCEEFALKRELPIYKDPSLFLPFVDLLEKDPKAGWEALSKESPLLTTVKGSQHFMRLGPARDFSNFGDIAKIYEVNDRRFIPRWVHFKNEPAKLKNSRIVPVKICGMGAAYTDTLGFILESDLETALKAEAAENAAMPPSTVGNPIPKLKRQN